MQNVLNWPRIWAPKDFNREKRVHEMRLPTRMPVLGRRQYGITPDMASGAAYLNDLFTDASGTNITSHVPDSGGAWSYYSGASIKENTTGAQMYCFSMSGLELANYSLLSPSADYTVTAIMDRKSLINAARTGILCRFDPVTGNGYTFEMVYLSPDSSWQLNRIAGGTLTSIASGVLTNGWMSGANTIALTMIGSNIIAALGTGRVYVGTDANYASAMYPGIYQRGVASADTTGFQWSSISSAAATLADAFAVDVDFMTYTAPSIDHWTDGAFPADIQAAPLWTIGDRYVTVNFLAAGTYNVTINGAKNTNIGTIKMYDQTTDTSTGTPAGSQGTGVSFNGATGALYNQAMGSLTIAAPASRRVWFNFSGSTYNSIKTITFTP